MTKMVCRERTGNIQGDLAHCIEVISGIKPPPSQFDEHYL